MKNNAQKASRRPLFNKSKTIQNKHGMQEIISKYNILKDHYQSLKKITSFFLPIPVLFNGQDNEKQKEPGTSDQLLFTLLNKFTKIPLLVLNYPTKLHHEPYIKPFLSYYKN